MGRNVCIDYFPYREHGEGKRKSSGISLGMPCFLSLSTHHKLATLGTRYSTAMTGEGYWLYIGTAAHITLHFRRLLSSTSHCTTVTSHQNDEIWYPVYSQRSSTLNPRLLSPPLDVLCSLCLIVRFGVFRHSFTIHI